MEPAPAPGREMAVNPVTWNLILVSVAATCVRILAKRKSLKAFQGDDYLALLALVRRHTGRVSKDLLSLISVRCSAWVQG